MPAFPETMDLPHTASSAKSHGLGGRLAIIYRCTHDDSIAAFHLLYHPVGDIIIKGAAHGSLLLAFAAGDAASYRLCADPHNFGIYTILFKLNCRFFECSISVTMVVPSFIIYANTGLLPCQVSFREIGGIAGNGINLYKGAHRQSRHLEAYARG